MGEGPERPPWYARFGGITGSESATQSISEQGIPVPPGGNFQGRKPRGRVDRDDLAGHLDERWSEESRCDRRAEVASVDWLTRTGTLRLGFEVTDDRPFTFVPGNFVRVELHVPDRGYRRGTYCIASAPSEYRRFDLLVRVVKGGRMSAHLASLGLGDEIMFRGPTGRSMVKAAGDGAVALVATGVGIAPFLSLSTVLLRSDPGRAIDLYWGLRQPDDICLTGELDRLAAAHPSFRYHVSLSEPPPGWAGLRGRLTSSLPPLLPALADRRFLLAGNGAMVEELTVGLSELGVSREDIYEEPYFNARHVADPAVVSGFVDAARAAGFGGTGDEAGEAAGEGEA